MIHTVYYIDNSIQEEFSARRPSLDEEQFFTDMASAYRHGACCLCGDINSLEYLGQLSGIAGLIYRAVLSRYTETGAILDAVRQVFVLTYRVKGGEGERDLSGLPEVLQRKRKCTFIHIPTAIANSWNLHTKCTLLAENLNDCDFYMFVARYYCRKRSLPGFPINFENVLGGGSTIDSSLENCVKTNKKPALCILDSDQKHGKTKLYRQQPARGNTLICADRMSKKLKSDKDIPPHELYPLYVHEIENLVPTQVLKELARDICPNMKHGLQRMGELEHVKGGEPILYYDYKNGFPHMKGKAMRTYWREVVSELGGNEASMPPEEKPKSGSYDPDLLFFPPLQSNILRHVLTKFEKMEDIAEIQLDPYLEDFWDTLGGLLLTWGYANEPLRA